MMNLEVIEPKMKLQQMIQTQIENMMIREKMRIATPQEKKQIQQEQMKKAQMNLTRKLRKQTPIQKMLTSHMKMIQNRHQTAIQM